MKAFSALLFLSLSASCLAAGLESKDACKEFVARHDYKGGVTAFAKAIADHPADARLLLGLGQLHYSFAKYAEAKAALERALAINPTDPVTLNFLAGVLTQKGDQAGSLKQLDLAIASDANYADAHFNRAVVLAMGNPPGKPAARDSYKRALELGCEPDDALWQLIK